MKKNKETFFHKLIDCHTHCSGIEFYGMINGRTPVEQSVTTLVKNLKDNGIDFAVTFPFPNTFFYSIYSYLNNFDFQESRLCNLPFEIENRNLLNQINHFKIKNVLPFLSFSLNTKVLEQVEYMENLITGYDVYGLKYHPFCDQHTLLDILKYPKLTGFMKKNNLPILIHSGYDDFSSPMDIYKLAEKEPEIRVCVAHMGRFNKLFYDALLKKPLPNLYVDSCPFLNFHRRYNQSQLPADQEIQINRNNPLKALEQLYEILPNNFIWGTDSPYSHTAKLDENFEEQIFTYHDEANLLKKLKKPIMDKIASQNTIRFLFG